MRKSKAKNSAGSTAATKPTARQSVGNKESAKLQTDGGLKKHGDKLRVP